MKYPSRNHGAALIITLAMVAMMTFLLVAFFSRSLTNLQVESASTGAARADLLAKSVGQIVVSDFKSEIIAGSKTFTSTSQSPVYLPTSSAASIPAVSRYAFTDAATFANLVKQSTGRFYPDAAPYNTNVKPIIQGVTEVTTDVASQNGRSVIAKRWDDPTNLLVPSGPLLLISAPPPATAPNYTRFYDNKMLPHWVMMTRQGVPTSQTWTTDWKNYTADNPNAAIGRFAYNIYNVGGLLDVNAAGYQETSGSTDLTVTALGQKGTPGLAQLSLIPGMGTSTAEKQSNAAAFATTWRNIASGGSPQDYLAYLGFSKVGSTYQTTNPLYSAGPVTGFLKPAFNASSADNRVLGRQDLIRLAVKTAKSPATTPIYGLSMAALPHLTHFSRELNAPSWSPTQNAASMGGSNDGVPFTAGVPYAYQTNSNSALAANRFLPNVRVAAGANWRRLTGEKAVEGEPLIKYRFPLSWLSLLQDNDPTTQTWDLTPEAKAVIKSLEARNLANGGSGLGTGTTPEAKAAWLVQRVFGLVWNQSNYRWDYTGSPSPTSTPTTIGTSLELLGDASPSTPALVVCKESREPNFFELLKCGILSGSLGNSSDYESMCVNLGADSNPDFQVIQIGANIIDQADSDSYPTRIAFGFEMEAPASIIATAATSTNRPTPTTETRIFTGVEDVPYIYSFVSTPYRIPAGEPNVNPATDPGSTTQNAQRDTIDGWLQFVMWKPQQQSASSAAPSTFRILFTGTNIHLTYFGDSNSPTEFPAGSGVKYNPRDTAPYLADQTQVTFSDTPADFRVPTLLGGMDPSATFHNFVPSQIQGKGVNPFSSPDSILNGKAQLPRGMWLGETYRPEQISTAGSPNASAPPYTHTEFRCSPDSKFELQYLEGTSTWRTYQRFNRFGVGTGQYFRGRGLYGYSDSPFPLGKEGSQVLPAAGPPAFCALDNSTVAISAVDPRSRRYGLLAHFLDGVSPFYTTPAMIPPTGTAYPFNWKYYLKQGWAPKATTPYNMSFGPSNARFVPSWSGGTLQNPWAGRSTANNILLPTQLWADNNGTVSYYKDMDGVQRRGDGDSTNSVYSVRPLQLTTSSTLNSQDLGRVLNRPFRSVGELAYAFRDEPYKSLNLFTSKSADTALLDLFNVNEQPAIVAGKVNLNSQNPEVLQAVIVGAAREEQSSTNIITSDEALTIAKNLIANVKASPTDTTGPIMNPAEIANRLSLIMPPDAAADTTLVKQQNKAIKTRLEVVGRALTGSGQTRTWNFLVDIIAQSGRFVPNATTTAQFAVEGEKRYWLHVAIDRYTGQVVDQQLESVME